MTRELRLRWIVRPPVSVVVPGDEWTQSHAECESWSCPSPDRSSEDPGVAVFDSESSASALRSVVYAIKNSKTKTPVLGDHSDPKTPRTTRDYRTTIDALSTKRR
jgi:hypothetical protein